MDRKLKLLTVTAALSLTSWASFASEEAPDVEKKAEADESVVTALGPVALSEEALGEQRAAAKLELQEVTINDSDQGGLLTDNTATNNRTGRNSIGGDAFVNASGHINAVQNTGNNVLIQSSTIVNVSVEQ